MKIQILIVSVLVLFNTNVFGQQNFSLKEASKNFDVKIEIANCADGICEGASSVSLTRKNAAKPFQTIRMSNLYLELGDEGDPTANLVELYGMNNSGVIFDDFNFDGAEDLALRNGNQGAYGGPSYDIFLFSKTSRKFVKNAALTRLASENLGLFRVNKKTKTLETFDKSGCCWHQTERFRVVNNRPQKVYVFTEDATGTGGKWVLLTTEKLVGGKWRKTTKRALISDYYK